MKNIIILTILTLLFAVQAQVEKIAIEVLKAYKDQDVELLKKNASGIMKPAINEGYFEDEAVRKDMKTLDGWDGKIREIRYDSDNIMGNFVVVAAVYYSDSSDEEINTVMLSTMDGKNWVFLGTGLETVPKADFIKLSTTIPTPKKKETKEIKVEESKSNMDIELASGDEFKNVGEDKLIECFNSLDDEIFFMTLSNKDGFLQTAFSDGNYVVEYSEGEVQYESDKVLPKDATLSIFKKYLQGGSDWKDGVTWVKK